jgi:hypothetical protein
VLVERRGIFDPIVPINQLVVGQSTVEEKQAVFWIYQTGIPVT